jgi:hypothetical protein
MRTFQPKNAGTVANPADRPVVRAGTANESDIDSAGPLIDHPDGKGCGKGAGDLLATLA